MGIGDILTWCLAPVNCIKHSVKVHVFSGRLCHRDCSLLMSLFSITLLLSAGFIRYQLALLDDADMRTEPLETATLRMRYYYPLGDSDSEFEDYIDMLPRGFPKTPDDYANEWPSDINTGESRTHDINSSFCHGRKLTQDKNNNNTQKLILFWNMFRIFYYYGFDRDQFDFSGICGTNSCRTSVNRADFLHADAVIFSAKEVLSWRNFPRDPRVKRSRHIGYPRHAHKNQIFVWFHIEAPVRYRRLPWRSYSDIFNLTFTYLSHPGTDIHVDYGRILRRDSNDVYIMPNARVLTKKTKLVAWMVSNCHPANLRAAYVTRLKRYVKVDIYGRCGKKMGKCVFTKDGCFEDIARQYKFYLAFENSHCQDYVTEKMYRTLTMDMVPIVMGGADYKRMFPPHSFIDVRDFKSPRHLARHLHVLSGNNQAYLAYFNWKKKYVSDNVHDAAPNMGLCTLCGILHNPEYRYKSPCFDYKSYYDPRKYCTPREDERKLLGI